MDKEWIKTIRLFMALAFMYLSICVICSCISLKIEYNNKESKRAIMFKLIDSNYVCPDVLAFAKENL